MDQNELREVEISNDFDYSNIVADVESISFLVQYCDSIYQQFSKICEEDEEKNLKLKSEFKCFQYKKTYSTGLEIAIRDKVKNFNTMSCKNLESFKEAINAGHLKGADSLNITLDLSFKRGKNFQQKEYENIFKITFKPYDIKFNRKSNHDDSTMNLVENQINDVLKKFKTQNTIFCTK